MDYRPDSNGLPLRNPSPMDESQSSGAITFYELEQRLLPPSSEEEKDSQEEYFRAMLPDAPSDTMNELLVTVRNSDALQKKLKELIPAIYGRDYDSVRLEKADSEFQKRILENLLVTDYFFEFDSRGDSVPEKDEALTKANGKVDSKTDDPKTALSRLTGEKLRRMTEKRREEMEKLQGKEISKDLKKKKQEFDYLTKLLESSAPKPETPVSSPVVADALPPPQKTPKEKGSEVAAPGFSFRTADSDFGKERRDGGEMKEGEKARIPAQGSDLVPMSPEDFLEKMRSSSRFYDPEYFERLFNILPEFQDTFRFSVLPALADPMEQYYAKMKAFLVGRRNEEGYVDDSEKGMYRDNASKMSVHTQREAFLVPFLLPESDLGAMVRDMHGSGEFASRRMVFPREKIHAFFQSKALPEIPREMAESLENVEFNDPETLSASMNALMSRPDIRDSLTPFLLALGLLSFWNNRKELGQSLSTYSFPRNDYLGAFGAKIPGQGESEETVTSTRGGRPSLKGGQGPLPTPPGKGATGPQSPTASGEPRNANGETREAYETRTKSEETGKQKQNRPEESSQKKRSGRKAPKEGMDLRTKVALYVGGIGGGIGILTFIA